MAAEPQNYRGGFARVYIGLNTLPGIIMEVDKNLFVEEHGSPFGAMPSTSM